MMYNKPMINFSWLELKPNIVKGGNQEEFEEYYSRIEKEIYYNHIPKSVFEEWIHAHHYKIETIRNYAWMDYRKISFEITSLNTNELIHAYIVKNYSDCVNDLHKAKTFSDFRMQPIDLDHWKLQGTWRTPPIVLDINSLPSIPNHSDISRKHKYQLVEGHTRFGYLISLLKMSQKEGVHINDQHDVYLMKYNEKQIRESNRSCQCK